MITITLTNEQLNNLKWILEFAIVNEVIDFEKYDPDTLNISDNEAAKRTANDIRKIINIIEENSTTCGGVKDKRNDS